MENTKKIKNFYPVWNVYVEDINSRKIKVHNIFDHYSFYNDVKKDLEKSEDKEEFANKLRSNLMYYYWSKYEWEIVLTSFPPRIDKKEFDRITNEAESFNKEHGHYPYSMYAYPNVGEKIDVYEQVMLNFGILVDYLWGFKGVEK